MLREIDNLLNKYTMYQVVVYGLSALLVFAAILGLTGAVSVPAGALLVSVVVLLVSSYAANKAASLFLRVPSNAESWLISALILACILPPVDSLAKGLYAALAGLLAMASKYVITYRGSHIFNPAAFGAFVVSITGLLPATWWIATPWLTPFTVLLALVVLRKQRRFHLFFAFAVSALVLLVLTGTVLQGLSLTFVLRDAVLSWPIIFFGSIMLTEPATLPPVHHYRLLLAIIVGLLFASQLHIGRLATTPQAVLLFGNILTVLAVPTAGVLLRLKEVRRLSSDIYEACFDRPPQLRFAAGQYAELTLPHTRPDARGNRRTFSVASSPYAPDIRFAFRARPSGSSFKTALTRATPGQVVRLSHVAGDFTLPADEAKPLLFIAGGIGITPYRSMVASLTSRRDIVLIYLSADPQSFVYADDFNQAASLGVRTIYLQDQLSAKSLLDLVPDLQQRLIYVSGPDGMVRNYKKLLRSMGIQGFAVKADYFAGY